MHGKFRCNVIEARSGPPCLEGGGAMENEKSRRIAGSGPCDGLLLRLDVRSGPSSQRALPVASAKASRYGVIRHT